MVVPKVHKQDCRDNLSHSLYIPTLAFLDNVMHLLIDFDPNVGNPSLLGIFDSVCKCRYTSNFLTLCYG